jgi:CheY-like chemotaxis protein
MTMNHPAGNVLIVEDDADTREMLETFLSLQGFQAMGAEDGLEALHMLRSVRHRTPDVPCVVLLDLSMPRLGGGEFRRAQLADPRVAGIPVVVLSGAVDVEQQARKMGAVAAVPKPINFPALLDLVRRHCRKPDITLPSANRLPYRGRENGA